MSELQILYPKKWDGNHELTGRELERKGKGLFQDTIIMFE
jgi:hypothetical protein